MKTNKIQYLCMFSSLLLTSFFIQSSYANDTLQTRKSTVRTTLDQIVIDVEKIHTKKNHRMPQSKPIYIHKKLNGIRIEDQNAGITACIGVNACNDMIAYCVGELDSDPACVEDSEGQPVGCVC